MHFTLRIKQVYIVYEAGAFLSRDSLRDHLLELTDGSECTIGKDGHSIDSILLWIVWVTNVNSTWGSFTEREGRK